MSERHPTGEQLNAYVLEELAAAARQDVAAHLGDCPSCRAAATALEAALTAYREAGPAVVDEIALGRLLAARPPAPAPRPRWVTVALTAAAAAVIFMGGFWTGRGDALRSTTGRARTAPLATPETVRHSTDRQPPVLVFAAADADLMRGLAPRDTTWN